MANFCNEQLSKLRGKIQSTCADENNVDSYV